MDVPVQSFAPKLFRNLLSLDGAAPEVSSEFAVQNLGDKMEEVAPKMSSEFYFTKKERGKRVRSSALRDLGNEIGVC